MIRAFMISNSSAVITPRSRSSARWCSSWAGEGALAAATVGAGAVALAMSARSDSAPAIAASNGGVIGMALGALSGSFS